MTFRYDLLRACAKVGLNENNAVRQAMSIFVADGRLVTLNIEKTAILYRDTLRLQDSNPYKDTMMKTVKDNVVSQVKEFLKRHRSMALYIRDNMIKITKLSNEQQKVITALDVLINSYPDSDAFIGELDGSNSGPMQVMFGTNSPVIWDRDFYIED